MNKPIIVLNSALVDLLDEEELRFVIAHELGHALSGHAVYQTCCNACWCSAAWSVRSPSEVSGCG